MWSSFCKTVFKKNDLYWHLILVRSLTRGSVWKESSWLEFCILITRKQLLIARPFQSFHLFRSRSAVRKNSRHLGQQRWCLDHNYQIHYTAQHCIRNFTPVLSHTVTLPSDCIVLIHLRNYHWIKWAQSKKAAEPRNTRRVTGFISMCLHMYIQQYSIRWIKVYSRRKSIVTYPIATPRRAAFTPVRRSCAAAPAGALSPVRRTLPVCHIHTGHNRRRPHYVEKSWIFKSHRREIGPVKQ